MQKHINISIFENYTRNILIKDNHIHYTNDFGNHTPSIMKPLKINTSNFHQIKNEVLKTDISHFLKYINADIKEVEEGEENEEEEEKETRIVRKKVKTEKSYIEDLEKKRNELQKQLSIVNSKLLTETAHNPNVTFVHIPRDIFNYILQLIHMRRRIKKEEDVYNPIKALFITSKAIRELYYDLFLLYLSIQSGKEQYFKEEYVTAIHHPILNEIEYGSNVTYLNLKNALHRFDFNLPQGLKYLILPNWFNESIDDFPDSIQHLEMGKNFNSSITKFPADLIFLKFGENFNQPINNGNALKKLKYLEVLIFGIFFNYPVDNFLPDSLNFLKFGKEYNLSVDKLPLNLKHLEFGEQFNKNVDKLPPNLEYLKFGENFNKNIDSLPKKLKSLILGFLFNTKIKFLPISLEHLEINSYYFNKSIDFLNNNVNLKYLKLGPSFNHTINNLPDSIEYLELGNYWDLNFNRHVIIKKLPYNLKEFYMNYNNFDTEKEEKYITTDVENFLNLNPGLIIYVNVKGQDTFKYFL